MNQLRKHRSNFDRHAPLLAGDGRLGVMLKFQGDLHWNFAELEDLADSGVEEDRPSIVPVFEGSDQILKLLQKIPFQPFSADAAKDVVNPTPTRDHVLAAKKALVIENDGGLVDLIPCTYIR